VKTARFLVTGGAGFIGSHLVEALLARGESVRVLDDLATGTAKNLATSEERSAERIDIMRGDIRDLDTVRAAVAGVEVVFHQAALASVPRSIADPLTSLLVNVVGTQHVLMAARDAGVRRVVYASSSSVYGNTDVLPKHEELPSRPMSPYALHKSTGEQLCVLFAQLYGLETVALRYFNVFGPRQDPASPYAAVIPRFLAALQKGRCPAIYGDGEQTRDFTFVANVVRANLLAAEAPAVVGQIINVGCGERISINRVLRYAAALLGVEARAEYLAPRVGDVRDSLADITLARELLGYEPTVSFEEGLALTVEARRERPPQPLTSQVNEQVSV
jgi:nucleoside-diphosphate-sugar epimerase